MCVQNGADKVASVRDELPLLRDILVADGAPKAPLKDLHALMHDASDAFEVVDTKADDPALVCMCVCVFACMRMVVCDSKRECVYARGMRGMYVVCVCHQPLCMCCVCSLSILRAPLGHPR